MIVKLLTTNNERGKERDLTQECSNKILNTQNHGLFTKTVNVSYVFIMYIIQNLQFYFLSVDQ